MQDVNNLIMFLGWCTIINIGILIFSSLTIFLFKSSVTKLHSELSGVERKALLPLYFKYLGNYKICIIVFNFVPYLALKVMI